MKLTKKQKTALESLRTEIKEILIEATFLADEWKGDFHKIEMRAVYDSFRILNIIQDKFNETKKEN